MPAIPLVFHVVHNVRCYSFDIGTPPGGKISYEYVKVMASIWSCFSFKLLIAL